MMIKMFRPALFKRLIACMLIMVMSFMLPSVHVQGATKAVTYVKDFKLYIVKNDKTVGSFDEAAATEKAKKWFNDNGYNMIEGNLNLGASGMLTKEVGVYMGYSTTTNRKEAVTDIAVMNEKGNYSEGEYERILKTQRDTYKDLVAGMKDMLTEYRKNVNAGVKTAIQAKDFMNMYKDDDSGRPLGDLLMDIEDDNLVEILLQANGAVILMMQEKLAYACDTAKTTWLERMEKLGGYNKLYKKYYTAYKDKRKAEAALDEAYKEKALELSASWNDISQHMNNIMSYLKDNSLEGKSHDEIISYLKKNMKEEDTQNFYRELSVTDFLDSFAYEDGSLLTFFMQKSDDVTKGNNIRKLYPLAASLSDGQQAGVNSSVSLFTMVLNAVSAMNFNDEKSALTKSLDEAMKADEEEYADRVKEKLNEALDDIEDVEKISIYEGVDRDLYNGGVAVTSTAKSFSKEDGSSWVNSLINKGFNSKPVMALAIGTAAFGATASLLAVVTSLLKTREAKIQFNTFKTEFAGQGNAVQQQFQYYSSIFGDEGNEIGGIAGSFEANSGSNTMIILGKDGNIEEITFNHVNFNKEFSQQSSKARAELYAKAEQRGLASKLNKYLDKLKIGVTVIFILLAVVDIVLTGIALYNYYNVDHLPIPHHMVDTSYSETDETSFINYVTVRDQDDKPGDVNGNGGKQWLALYQTKDKDAGDPILAPENGKAFKIIIQNGNDGAPTENHSPLHMFGTPNVAQNLTYADGTSGYSFSDPNNGTYLFFRRDTGEEIVLEDEETEEQDGSKDVAAGDAASGSGANTATAMNGGTLVLSGAIGLVAGVFIGVVGVSFSRKRRRS